MVGDRLRQVRRSQARSLADVASHADISVATLSRIENDKQSIDLRLFVLLAKILAVAPADLLDDASADERDAVDPLTRRIAALGSRERVDLWRNMAAHRRGQRNRTHGGADQLSLHVEELVAQIELLREELEVVRKRVKHR
jgi:transcriptional regulator with XRE-family HTH domain